MYFSIWCTWALYGILQEESKFFSILKVWLNDGSNTKSSCKMLKNLFVIKTCKVKDDHDLDPESTLNYCFCYCYCTVLKPSLMKLLLVITLMMDYNWMVFIIELKKKIHQIDRTYFLLQTSKFNSFGGSKLVFLGMGTMIKRYLVNDRTAKNVVRLNPNGSALFTEPQPK